MQTHNSDRMLDIASFAIAGPIISASSSADHVIIALIEEIEILRINQKSSKIDILFTMKTDKPIIKIFATLTDFMLLQSDLKTTIIHISSQQVESVTYASRVTVYKDNLLCYGQVVFYKDEYTYAQGQIIDAILINFEGDTFIVAVTYELEVFKVVNGAPEAYEEQKFSDGCILAGSYISGVFAIGTINGKVAIMDFRTLRAIYVYEVQSFKIEYLQFLPAENDLLLCGSKLLYLLRAGMIEGEVLVIAEVERLEHCVVIENEFLSILKVYKSKITISTLNNKPEAEKWFEMLAYANNDYIDPTFKPWQRKFYKYLYSRDFSACYEIIFDTVSKHLEENNIPKVREVLELLRPIQNYLEGKGFDEEIESEELYQNFRLEEYLEISKYVPLPCIIEPTIPDEEINEQYWFIVQLLEMKDEDKINNRLFIEVEDFIKQASSIVTENLLQSYVDTIRQLKISQYNNSKFIDFVISCYPLSNENYINVYLTIFAPSIFSFDVSIIANVIPLLQKAITYVYRDELFKDIFNVFLITCSSASVNEINILKGFFEENNEEAIKGIQIYIRQIHIPIYAQEQDNIFIDESIQENCNIFRDIQIIDQSYFFLYIFSLIATRQLQLIISVISKTHSLLTSIEKSTKLELVFIKALEQLLYYVIWPIILLEISEESPIFSLEELTEYCFYNELVMNCITISNTDEKYCQFCKEQPIIEELTEKLDALMNEIAKRKGDFDQYDFVERKQIAGELEEVVSDFRQQQIPKILTDKIEDLEMLLAVQ